MIDIFSQRFWINGRVFKLHLQISIHPKGGSSIAMKLECLHLAISGRVQGVGFRYATLRSAMALGLVGWVKNREDGSVECFVEGDVQKIALLHEWTKQGPKSAHVKEVKILKREFISQA